MVAARSPKNEALKLCLNAVLQYLLPSFKMAK